MIAERHWPCCLCSSFLCGVGSSGNSSGHLQEDARGVTRMQMVRRRMLLFLPLYMGKSSVGQLPTCACCLCACFTPADTAIYTSRTATNQHPSLFKLHPHLFSYIFLFQLAKVVFRALYSSLDYCGKLELFQVLQQYQDTLEKLLCTIFNKRYVEGHAMHSFIADKLC
jgi:hypothetical protein